MRTKAGDHGAHALRGAQQAAGVGADQQDILGEDRDERGGAGEQDGEQVERDGAQQELVAADEHEAGEHRSEVAIGPGVFAGVRRHVASAHEEDGGGGAGKPEGRYAIGDDGRPGIEQAAQPGPQMVATCQEVDDQATALAQLVLRHQIGHQGARRRRGDGAGDAEQERHQQDGGNGHATDTPPAPPGWRPSPAPPRRRSGSCAGGRTGRRDDRPAAPAGRPAGTPSARRARA